MRKLGFSPVKQKLPMISSAYISANMASPCYSCMLQFDAVVVLDSAVAKKPPCIDVDRRPVSSGSGPDLHKLQ